MGVQFYFQLIETKTEPFIDTFQDYAVRLQLDRCKYYITINEAMFFFLTFWCNETAKDKQFNFMKASHKDTTLMDMNNEHI